MEISARVPVHISASGGLGRTRCMNLVLGTNLMPSRAIQTKDALQADPVKRVI